MFTTFTAARAAASAMVGCAIVVAQISIAGPASADDAGSERPLTATREDVALDLATFEGPLVVATPSGAEVVVDVKAGQASVMAETIQAADIDGTLDSLPIRSSRAGCGQKVRSVAGIGNTYATSVQGCAVIGYPGYRREYVWENTSDVYLCTRARGFNAVVATWYSTGCGGGATFLVPWGNTLAYTQMQGSSMSWATGAAYVWRA
jgi:hypothetical protein